MKGLEFILKQVDFSGSKCQFSKGTSGNLPFFLGGMAFVLALEASCLVQVQGPSGPEGAQGPSEVDLTRERSRSWAEWNDIQRRSP